MVYVAIYPVLLAACSRVDTPIKTLYSDAFMYIEVVEGGRIRITVFGQNRAVYQEMRHYVLNVLMRQGCARDFCDNWRTEPPWSFSFAPVGPA